MTFAKRVVLSSRWIALGSITTFLAILFYSTINRLRHEITFAALRDAVRMQTFSQVAAAFVLTVTSYLLLTLYDFLALRMIGKPLPWRTAALASFTSYAVSHNLGFSVLSGGSVRYRAYKREGLSWRETAIIMGASGTALTAGLGLVAAASLILMRRLPAGYSWPMPIATLRYAAMAIVAAIFVAILVWPKFAARLPSANFFAKQPRQLIGAFITLAVMDILASSGALFVLIPQLGIQDFAGFFAIYALSIALSTISHVPGGLGVFEGTMLLSFPLGSSGMLGALIVYRLIYYVLPLCAAMALLGAQSQIISRRKLGRVLGLSAKWAGDTIPLLAAAAAFLAGTVLLISGATPSLFERLFVLHRWLPTSLIAASHLGASVVGLVLLVCAPALARRLNGAAWLARVLCLLGAALSLGKGIDWEEAAVLIAVAGLIQVNRASFFRPSRLTADALTRSWLIGIGGIVVLSTSIALYAVRDHSVLASVTESATHREMARILRSGISVVVLFLGLVLWRMLAPSARTAPPLAIDPNLVEHAMQNCPRSDANLVWLGDKHVLANPEGTAFIQYAVRGHTWIVMGDPVGPESCWQALFWTLRESADHLGHRLVCYQLSKRALPYVIALGLTLVKYGEEAIIDIGNFNLIGRTRKNLRNAVNHALRAGATFGVIPAADVESVYQQLEAVSRDWLAHLNAEEKGFSIGRFERAYIKRFDCAVVQQGNRVIAFANIWQSGDHDELSVDMMRQVTDAPNGTMELLFASLMQWGRDRGFKHFSLGLAPLAGLESKRLAPRWAKLAVLFYNHGERLYGFRGLHAFKDKFKPRWEPVFIAGLPGFALWRSIADIRAMIG